MRSILKHCTLLVLSVLIAVPLMAQKVVLIPETTGKAFYRDISSPLRDINPKQPGSIENTWPAGIVKNNFEKRKRIKSVDNNSTVTDRAIQKFMGTKQLVQTVGANFDGMSRNEAGGATPPDPSGDVGPMHYFQMLNLAFEIYDKTGNSLYGPTANNTIFDGWDDGQPWNNTNDGDPIVLYDDQADRWMVSHFSLPSWGGPYYMLIAYSVSNDPLGAYYRYAFQFNNFPDYPKLAIWPDGLYITLNSNSNNAAVFQRDSMLVGGDAGMVSFSIPDYPGSGFKSALPADCDGPFPAYGTPNYLMYYNDNSWGNYPTDHLRIWEFATNWSNINSSTLTLQSTLVTEAFDSGFSNGWNNISQPNNQKLDAIEAAMMFRLQYRQFPAYAAMVCNYVVDVSGSDHAGIRWYELRKDTIAGSSWYIHQQGTYAPDNENRWMASMSMDMYGNIAMAYSVSSGNTYPSLRFTGHSVGAPLGVMDITETEIVTGTGSQNGTNRYGDYSQMGVDPTDDATFWFTSEYIPSGGQWKTRIVSFIFDPVELVPINAGIVNFVAPQSSSSLTNQEAISVTVTNAGTDTLYSIPIDLHINGNLVAEDTISIMLIPAGQITHTFSYLADMSALGSYDLLMAVHHAGDTIPDNDSLMVTVEQMEPAYCDASGSTAGEYIFKVELDNFSNTSGNQAYTFYSNDTVGIKAGADHQMTVTLGSGNSNDQVIVWFDWNQDLDFDDMGEQYFLGNGSGPTSSTIAVPANATFGNSRMRVRLHNLQQGPNNSPCGTSNYGEVEDYVILVQDPLSNETIFPDQLELSCYPNPVHDLASLQFKGINQDLVIQIIDDNGKEIHVEKVEGNDHTNNLDINMEAYPAGLYFVRVRLSNYTVIKAEKLIKI
jgi:hypothetical protein